MNTSSSGHLFTRTIDILAIVVSLYFVGAGIGFWQGYAAAVDNISAALIGGPAAVTTGLILYFAVLRGRASFSDAAWIISAAAAAGICAALLLKAISHGEAGWFSIFVTPFVAFVIAFIRSKHGSRI